MTNSWLSQAAQGTVYPIVTFVVPEAMRVQASPLLDV